MLKTKNKYKRFVKILVFLISLIFIVLGSNYQLETMRLTTDFVSWALSGMAPIFKIGYPYVNYWGINPPGVLMFTALWGGIVGSSLRSFHILYIILLSTIVFLTWKILNKFFSLMESLVLFLIFILIFFSKTVQSQFFPSEINGLFFALIGLYFALKSKASKKDFFWASFSFILAGQMKEVFALTGLALVPQLLRSVHLGKKKTWEFISFSLLGVFVSLAIIIGYLGITKSYGEYKSILNYKSQQFSLSELDKVGVNSFRSIHFPKERFIYTKYQVPMLLFLSFNSLLVYLSLVTKSKKNNKKAGKNNLTLSFSLPKKSLEYATLFFFWFGSTIGYLIQGRYGNKYEIQSLLPMILIIAISVKIIFKTILEFFEIKIPKKTYSIVMVILLIVFLFPKKFFFEELYSHLSDYDLRVYIHRWINLENPEALALETKIKENTNKSDCITAVYGWGIGSHYYYSQRRSCSKYFLVNILPFGTYRKYAQELINNPASAIIYNTGGSDMNTKGFEKKVFDFPKVLENCYVADNEFQKLHWPKFEGKELKACLKLGLPN